MRERERERERKREREREGGGGGRHLGVADAVTIPAVIIMH